MELFSSIIAQFKGKMGFVPVDMLVEVERKIMYFFFKRFNNRRVLAQAAE
jgi:hypothetical protein